MLLDDTTNRSSDANTPGTEYEPGQNVRDSYRDDQFEDSDGYQSSSPSQPSEFEDSGYESPNRFGYQDPEFRDQFDRNEAMRRQGGFAAQVKRAMNRASASVGRTAGKEGAKALTGKGTPVSALRALGDDTPENRELVKQEAKDRIRKYARDKAKEKLGTEVKDLSKDALKKAAKESAQKAFKKAGKEGIKQGGKLAARAGAEVGGKAVGAAAGAGTAVSGTAAGAVGVAGVASAPETLGLGLLVALLIELALYLGLSDAIDYLFELGAAGKAVAQRDFEAAKQHRKKALFHAQKAAMLLLMGFLLLIAIGLSLSVGGIIFGIPMLFLLSLYMFLGMAFPKVGLLQGLSKKPEQVFLIIFDVVAFIILMALVAALFWYICERSGLGTGLFAQIGAKLVDWWSGAEFVSTFNDACTKIGNF